MSWKNKLNHIKGILIDIDGTLVNSRKQLTKKTAQTLKELDSAGYKLGAATGRSLSCIKNYIFPFFPADALHITDDGASIVNVQGHYLYRKIVPSKIAKQVGQLALSMRANIAFSQDEKRFYNHDFYHHMRSKDKWNKNMALARDAEDWSTPNLMIYNVRPKLSRRLEQLKPDLDEFSLSSRKTGYGLTYSLRVKGANKGTASVIWGSHQSLVPQQMLIFGDSENDLEAMNLLGVGVAMGNAVKVIKEAADVVIEPSDKDGVSKFARRYLLDR